ncbi:GNAT family N-acetyltransferase [Streptomyces acidiscabies]|uniref:GNAT family N-acetyltransferase n=1 Tax=Streptomyces acidiscabies TaxID=42234 RepID=UPI0038F7DD3D
MAVQLGNGVTLEGFRLNAEDGNVLKVMYTDYLLEEFQRIEELAFGNPVAPYLITMFIKVDDEHAGFLSLDRHNNAVEIIYVKPDYRHRGLATLALQEMMRHSPTKLALKTPLSPGGEALATQLDLGLEHNFPHEEARNQEALRTMAAGVRTTCRHAARRNPLKPCPRCYQTALRRYASRVIDTFLQ